jgi:hypothetical protein
MKSFKAIVFATTLTLGASQLNAANQEQLTGVITDSMCGASHMAKDKTPAECTRICVKDGMKYALLVGDKVYTLTGHESELDKLAGEKVTVKGTVNSDTVSVDSVAVSK